MAIGFGLLHLSSDQFWAMTIREMQAACLGLFGEEENGQPLSRSELDHLMQIFPDQ